MWPFRRKQADPETRATGGYTAEIIAARAAHISGARGVAELTATVQGCVSLWENGFALADVDGDGGLLDRRTMALVGRALALRGEFVAHIGDRLTPAADWDISTADGEPRAYRLSLPDAGGGRTLTALAGEILHVRTGCDPAAPYAGTAPLRRAALTADLLQAIEGALAEVYQNAPLGSTIATLPDAGADDMMHLRDSFRGRRGAVLVIEGQAQAAAAGMHVAPGKAPDSLSPDLSRSMTKETLTAARDAVCMAFGILPGLANPATTGPMVREAQRHLATWTLQPLAALLAEEATTKLGGPVSIDTLRPLQAFDAGGRARALSAIIGALAQAKEAGIDPAMALKLVDWHTGHTGER